MKIVITGAGGLVGREFVRQLSASHRVIALTHRDLDIANREAVDVLVASERPELIINCAVVGVDACELDPSRAWSVNAAGAENLARAASTIDAEFVQLSTNYVFDGERTDGSFYSIEDTPNPVNVYGETKLAGERAVLAACKQSFIVRTSWVFGEGKNNFFSTAKASLIAGQSLRVVTDVWASATYVRDLVSRVTEILSHHRYVTYHVVNSDLCSYYEFALEVALVLKVSDLDAEALIQPVKAAELFRSARRPRYTPLRCLISEELGLVAMRGWRAAAAVYVHDAQG